jgi:hypothetical protein
LQVCHILSVSNTAIQKSQTARDLKIAALYLNTSFTWLKPVNRKHLSLLQQTDNFAHDKIASF